MALSAAGLSALIKSNLSARPWFNKNDPIAQQFCDDIASAIVQHITQNAAVSVTSTLTPTEVVTQALSNSGGPVVAANSTTITGSGSVS